MLSIELVERDRGLQSVKLCTWKGTYRSTGPPSPFGARVAIFGENLEYQLDAVVANMKGHQSSSQLLVLHQL